MAKFRMYIDNSFVKRIERMGNFDMIARRLLKAAEPILLAEIQRQVANHRLSSDMYGSIKATNIRKAKNDAYYISIRPTGKDKNGVRNMAKLMYLEFGKSDQAPRPVLTTAVKNAEGRVIEAMRREYEKILNE